MWLGRSCLVWVAHIHGKPAKMVKLVEQKLMSASVFKMIRTFCDTCMLFSCMFMMASEIFTSIGSMTDSKLKGPSSLSARLSMASEKHRGREGGDRDQIRDSGG